MEAFEFTLLLFVLVYTLIFFCHLLLKSRKSELQQKNYFIGVAVFSLSFFLTRFFLLLNDLIYPETLDLSLRQGILYILASFIAAIGVFWLTYIVERFVYPKLHYIPSITLLISAILILVLPRINNINLVTIYTAVSGGVAVLIPILYSIVGFKLSGKTRKKSFLLAFGILLLLLGNILNMGVLRKDFPIFGYLSPMTILIGLIIFHYSLFLRIEKLPSEAEMSIIKTLGLDFSRREKITEEEVKFYKEQTICVVCKGVLGRYNVYLCPECKVLYCVKCSKTLTELENACWVCDTPFDESKPVKLPEKEEVEMSIEEDIQKKK